MPPRPDEPPCPVLRRQAAAPAIDAPGTRAAAGTAGPAGDPAIVDPARQSLATAVLLAGTFIVVLDFFIINVALPTLQRELSATDAQTQWFVVTYGLAYAASLIAGGRLGDRFGHRECFRAGMALFGAASVACGLATDPLALCAARIAQGLGAALVSPQVLVLLGRWLPRERQAWAFARYGAVLGVASTGGQILGGALLGLAGDAWGWRLCFLVNVPVCALAWWAVPRVLPPAPRASPPRLDVAGLLLITGAMLAAIAPIVEGRQAGWPAWTWASGAVALVAFATFAGWQRHLARQGREGLMPPALLAHRRFVAGLVATLAFYVGNASHYFVLAIALQRGLGLSPWQAGTVFACLAVGFMTTTLAAVPLKARFGARTLPAGALLLAIGHGLAWGVLTDPSDGRETALIASLCVALVVEGLGIGMVMAPLVATIVAVLPPRHAGVASGLMTTTHQAGNALGVAAIGAIFQAAATHDGGFDAVQGLRVSLLALTACSVLAALMLWPLARPRPS